MFGKNTNKFSDRKIWCFICRTGKWIYKDKAVNVSLCRQMKNRLFIPTGCLFDYLADWRNEELWAFVNLSLRLLVYKLTQSAGGFGIYSNMLWKRWKSTENPQVCLCLSICQTNRLLINWHETYWAYQKYTIHSKAADIMTWMWSEDLYQSHSSSEITVFTRPIQWTKKCYAFL